MTLGQVLIEIRLTWFKLYLVNIVFAKYKQTSNIILFGRKCETVFLHVEAYWIVLNCIIIITIIIEADWINCFY